MLETLRELLGRDPFIAFELVATSGDKVMIASADLVVLGESQLTYYSPRSNGVTYLRLNQIALMRIHDDPS